MFSLAKIINILVHIVNRINGRDKLSIERNLEKVIKGMEDINGSVFHLKIIKQKRIDMIDKSQNLFL